MRMKVMKSGDTWFWTSFKPELAMLATNYVVCAQAEMFCTDLRS